MFDPTQWDLLSEFIDKVSEASGGCRVLDKETKKELLRGYLEDARNSRQVNGG